MRLSVGAVSRGVARGYEILQTIADTDLSPQLLAKERIDSAMSGLIVQAEHFTAVLNDAVVASNTMTRNIGQIVTRLQFQDLAKQHFEHVIDGMMLMKSGLEDLEDATGAVDSSPERDQSEWLTGLLSNLQVGPTRQRFLRDLLLGGTALDGIGALDVSPDETAPVQRDVQRTKSSFSDPLTLARGSGVTARWRSRRRKLRRLFIAEHAAAGQEPHTLGRFQREAGAASRHHIDDQLGVGPVFELRGTHEELAAGDLAKAYILRARAEFTFRKAHGGAAVTAATRLMKRQIAVDCLQLRDDRLGGRRDSDAFHHAFSSSREDQTGPSLPHSGGSKGPARLCRQSRRSGLRRSPAPSGCS